MSMRLAINGFGHTGRMISRAGFGRPGLDFAAVNDLTHPKTLAHMLKYDSVHGQSPGVLGHTADSLVLRF
jgi:glyceraldehyde-3-phosphate dehydrogenase/erythrose-4-phosphate dehydrogenase